MEKIFHSNIHISRSVDAVYDHSVNIKGIDMFRFIVSESVFANATTNPNNKAFCTPDFEQDDCLPAGVLNMSACTGTDTHYHLTLSAVADFSPPK